MDYKKLISKLEYQAETIRNMNCTTMSAEEFEEAADAIETLLKERDAAKAELERIEYFADSDFLHYLDNTIHSECGYEYYSALFDLLSEVTNWEYDNIWNDSDEKLKQYVDYLIRKFQKSRSAVLTFYIQLW